jgi:hypothetical protein
MDEKCNMCQLSETVVGLIESTTTANVKMEAATEKMESVVERIAKLERNQWILLGLGFLVTSVFSWAIFNPETFGRVLKAWTS